MSCGGSIAVPAGHAAARNTKTTFRLFQRQSGGSCRTQKNPGHDLGHAGAQCHLTLAVTRRRGPLLRKALLDPALR